MCRMVKYHDTEIPIEDIQRVVPFDFFLSGQDLNLDDMKEAGYRDMADNIQRLFLERDNEYIRSMSRFVPRFLESNVFEGRVEVDTLIYIAKNCDFAQEVIIRYRTIMEMISPEIMRENIQRVLESTH